MQHGIHYIKNIPRLGKYSWFILLVGENDGFIESNGHIRFFLSSGKVRFEISPNNLKIDGLTMSSKVLRLARIVDG